MNIASPAILSSVRDFAALAHGTQKRKYTDEPYIEHPQRVMATCMQYTQDYRILAAALLHDVLEDTDTSPAQLLDFLLEVFDKNSALETVNLVVDLTDIYTRQNFPSLSRRARKDKEAVRLSSVHVFAQTIKYADILDNTDVTFNEPGFARKYLREGAHLLEVMEKGDPQLRERVKAHITHCISVLS